MHQATLYHNGRKYFVTLDMHGTAVAYYVEVGAQGRRTTQRLLWSLQRHGWKNGDIPQGLKDVLNARGASDIIARTMGW